MDFGAARIFVRVIDTGGFSRAAKSLGIPISTVSTRVAGLEKKLRVSLLKRTTRKFWLTEAGSNYYRYAREALIHLEKAESASQISQEELKGPIRLCVPTEMGRTIVCDLVAGFCEKHPEVEIEMVLTNRMPNLIADNIDVALILNLDEMVDSTLMSRNLGTIDMGLYASPIYLKSRPKKIRKPEDLTSQECVIYGPARNTPWPLHREGESVDIKVTGRILSDDMGTFIRMAVRGAGIAPIPHYLAREFVQKGELVRILPKWSFHHVAVHLLYPQQTYLPTRIRKFIDELVENIKVVF